MPSQKFMRAPMWCALSLALGLGLTAIDVDAAGLGRLSVQSGLGQPLRAELEVTSVGREEAPTLQVKLAPLSAFRAANLEFNPALTNIRFALDRRQDGSYLVRISSAQAVNEPYLDMMVELTWATGRVIREYTVLLDPPALKVTPDIVAPAAPPAPVAAAPVPLPRAAAPAPAASSQSRSGDRGRSAAAGSVADAGAGTCCAIDRVGWGLYGQVGRHAWQDRQSESRYRVAGPDAGRTVPRQSRRLHQ